MNILITGGLGFIGSNLTNYMISKGYDITVIDIIRGETQAKFSQCDVLDADRMTKIFKDCDFDAVVHLAGKSDVRGAVTGAEMEETNVRGTVNVLEAAAKNGIKKFIFASSSSVYGDCRRTASETMSTDSQISEYGATKKAAEIFCSLYHNLYGIETVPLRFFTVYGPGGRLNMAVMRFIKSIDEGVPIDVYGGGKIKRDFLFIDDAVNAIELAIKRKTDSAPINIGSGKSYTLDYLVGAVEDALGKKAKIRYTGMAKGDALLTMSNIKRAEKMLGWKPSTQLKNGVQKTVDWWKAGGSKFY